MCIKEYEGNRRSVSGATDIDFYLMLLLHQAVERIGDVFPCGAFDNFYDCMTSDGRHVYLWYNDSRGSTHITTMEL